MRGRDAIPEREIERLLSGVEPGDERLLSLAALLDQVRAEADRPVEEGLAARHVAAALAAHRAAGETAPHDPQPRSTPLMRLRKGLAAASATFILLIGATGVAAATGTGAGDALYENGLERAQELVQNGNAAASLEAAATVIGLQVETNDEHDDGDSNAPEALREAAETIRNNGSDASADVHERVATLLEYLADAQEGDGVDGQEVALIARGIGGPPDGVPAGPPDEVPVGPPDSVPVPTDKPGVPSEAPGPPSETGAP